MTRKTKIQTAVAAIALAVIAWAAWPGPDQAPVGVTYAGVAPRDSNIVAFAFTNASGDSVPYQVAMQQQKLHFWTPPNPWLMREVREIAGHAAVTQEVRLVFTNRWRIVFAEVASDPPSFVNRLQTSLAQFASGHHWPRLSQWLDPASRLRGTCGPVMLGNKPMPPSSVGTESL